MASVLDITPNVVETHAEASFDPYGRLLRMLMPSLRGVVVHDGYSNLVWASDEWDLSDEPELINEAIANALSDTTEFPGIARTIDADRVVYSFAVRGEHIELLGDRESRRTAFRYPNRTAAFADGPAVGAAGARVSAARTGVARKAGFQRARSNVKERDLELMMEISSNQSAAASDADEFSVRS